ncbi:restriction endonuclease subunit S [Cellulophaga sp. 20_2_10]|uniref:restriction endonuclease subunit S n=1 Tax=Cellulophaga sp. 20_2_10 TaxID=2942476 RepID=UPI00201AE0FA|nr:restriction endonuclease subunit S [Cellulophaga sp. 20_2_10]MCL5244476.1 restriction endonuclease subunit S [Cellulophaga sp. 20_2_10]
MTKFRITTVEEVAENFDNIRVPLSSKQRKDIAKIYPYYGAQSIIDYVDDFLFDGEYILVAEDGENLKSQNNNVCNLVNGKFWVNNHAHIIRAKEGNSTKYLCYYLNLMNFKPFVTGSAQPKLTKDNLNSIPLKIHKKEEQKQIAKVLSDLDAKIEVNNKINQELEAMAKTLYDYWFVQFDFPDANGKPYKSSGGKMVFNEALKREIPEDWEVKFLTEEMDLQYGFPFSTKLFNDEEKGVPVIRIRDILNCSISNYSTQDVDDKYKLNKGDIIVGMDGNFHINYWNKEGCYLNQRSLRIRSNEDSISEIQARFSIEPYIKAREKNVSRTTVAHLSAKDVNDLKVLKATNEIQLKANDFFKSNLDKIVSNREQNQKLSELRDWILPMLMNGQVSVGAVEEQLGMVAEDNVKYNKTV